MRYGVIPTTLIERLAISAGFVPIPVMDLLHSIIKSRVIMAGVRLGVFEALAREPRDAASLAAELHLDESSLELLLRTLVIADYLGMAGGRYRLSKLARDSMVAGGTRSLVGFAHWNYAHWDFVSHLEDLVRTGRGVDFHERLDDPEAWGHYQLAMLEASRFFASIVARRVPVRRGARRLLDVGGSHGLVGATVARRHPPLRSTVFDLPQAVPHAQAIAAREGLTDVVEHRAGNVLTDDLGTGWDVVLLSSLLHHFEPAQTRNVLRRLHAAISSGGTVAIWDIERPAANAKPTPGDGAALFFRLTSTAGTYHGSEYAAWLSEAGFTRVTVTRPRLSPGHVLVCGRT
jgi:2-polyprenyl-3-methyl-5-hydroxy-6-metoxy-1,4-benzoquinol methylase